MGYYLAETFEVDCYKAVFNHLGVSLYNVIHPWKPLFRPEGVVPIEGFKVLPNGVHFASSNDIEVLEIRTAPAGYE
jgi:hypothetical protein